ncbi:MAG: TusE/DsrC/DsvC family sulfur relay protein [Anaerolineae bacterium]|nr:TusE/DsrC/DsvC family sulfur relay protein [Anaerolineae bacterium]
MTLTADFSVLETLEFDDDGFLANASDWTEDIAIAVAAVLEIELTEMHWQVINFARAEFEANGEAPTIRRITKAGGVPTKELYSLFPGGAAKTAAKIAGLPKPTGCI